MNLALIQAKKNLGNTRENPSVACVITKNNHLISAGNTSFKGRPHAEEIALKKAGKKSKPNIFSRNNETNTAITINIEEMIIPWKI